VKSIEELEQEVTRLKNIIHEARVTFYKDSSDGDTAARMLAILSELPSNPSAINTAHPLPSL